MKHEQTQLAEFLSSIIEEYKVRHHLSGADAANLLAQYDALDFLETGYDLLHTQSLTYVVDEVERYLEKRGVRK